MYPEDGHGCDCDAVRQGQSVSGDVKIIHRYVSMEMGKLVVWYIQPAFGGRGVDDAARDYGAGRHSSGRRVRVGTGS